MMLFRNVSNWDSKCLKESKGSLVKCLELFTAANISLTLCCGYTTSTVFNPHRWVSTQCTQLINSAESLLTKMIQLIRLCARSIVSIRLIQFDHEPNWKLNEDRLLNKLVGCCPHNLQEAQDSVLKTIVACQISLDSKGFEVVWTSESRFDSGQIFGRIQIFE